MQPLQTFYTLEFPIRTYEVDSHYKLGLSNLLRFMQETAGRHLSDAGWTYQKMRDEDGFVFLLTRIALRIRRMPEWRETVAVKTWFSGAKGAQYMREMTFESAGEVLAESQTAWVTVNPETRRVLRPDLTLNPEGIRSEAIAGVAARRVERPEGMAFAGERPVRYSDLDCNHHVNNAVYADIVADYFPGEYDPGAVRFFALEYHNEALPGETLRIFHAAGGKNICHICGDAGDRRCFSARVELAD